MRSNAATANVDRFDAAMAAGDADAVADCLALDVECFHHPTGASWDREALLTLNRQVTRARGLQIRPEYLATFGDTFVLLREWSSWESLDDDDLGAFGAVERERIILVEVDASGRQRHVEFFAADHLRNAIVRLYERYADSCADGPLRQRAMTTASAVAVALSPEWKRYASAFAPDIEFIDHRTLGFGAGRGADELVRRFSVLDDLAEGLTMRIGDVLRCESDALVVPGGFLGTDRASGGAFEIPAIGLFLFGHDGRVVRYEAFPVEQEDEAVARCDALTAPVRQVDRRVRPNAATETGARYFAAIADRDIDAFGREMSDDYEIVHHPTGATYGRRGMMTTWRSIFRAQRLTFRPEVLATLGDALMLHRHALSIEQLVEEHLTSFGQLEYDEFVVNEVDAHGRFRSMELFDGEHLGDAFACLYRAVRRLASRRPRA